MRSRIATTVTAALLLGLWSADWAAGNGGPFVVKAPNGDPAAKGVLARLDPSLKPARETRLRVVKEDLSVQFHLELFYNSTTILPPRAEVTAAYTIENPTDEDVQIDFGFPILRGIYMIRRMSSKPDVGVKVDNQSIPANVISNSMIYGMIRDHARACIDKGVAADAELSSLVKAVRDAAGIVPAQPAKDETKPAVQPVQQTQPAAPATVKKTSPEAGVRARAALRSHLMTKLKWNDRDAALMVEYASLDFEPTLGWARDRWSKSSGWDLRGDMRTDLPRANLGPLMVIGEQKATQFFAQLASRFDKKVAATYESIFAAWGGEVRERSVDLSSGNVRLRELSSQPERRTGEEDPTVYARLDYIDPTVDLARAHKASCEAVLRNLPVTFTFAPMNLLHYEVKFPAKTTRLVTITYSQYCYTDTAAPASYQLAYVLQPASLWREFGPINLNVRVHKGIACKASAAIEKWGVYLSEIPGVPNEDAMDVYKTTLTETKQKQGELFIGIDRAAWDKHASAVAKREMDEVKKREDEAKKNAPKDVPATSGADLDVPIRSGSSVPAPPPG